MRLPETWCAWGGWPPSLSCTTWQPSLTGAHSSRCHGTIQCWVVQSNQAALLCFSKHCSALHLCIRAPTVPLALSVLWVYLGAPWSSSLGKDKDRHWKNVATEQADKVFKRLESRARATAVGAVACHALRGLKLEPYAH